VKLKRIINFTKEPREKLDIKTMRTKLKNIIPSIWIERWNWKPIKLKKKCQGKKIRDQKNKDEIEKYNIW
jgi:hypothetical protein